MNEREIREKFMSIEEWNEAGAPVCWEEIPAPVGVEVDYDHAYGRIRVVDTENLVEDIGFNHAFAGDVGVVMVDDQFTFWKKQ